MTVREMINELQALDLPDAVILRQRQGYGGNQRLYDERGANWDIVIVRQREDSMAPGQWFGTDMESLKSEPGYKASWAVVL